MNFQITRFLLTSSTRAVKVEDLHIASPESSRHQKVLANLDSAFIKQEDKNLPRLRRVSQSRSSEKIIARHELQKSRLDRRKQTFSSEDEDEDGGVSTISAQVDYHEDSATPSYPDYVDYDNDNNNFEEVVANEPKLTTEVEIKKEESQEPPAKRRRGRPKKNEQEKKEKVITRRSRRIVENPTLRKHHSLEHPSLMLVPKPLRVTGLIPGNGGAYAASSAPNTLLFTQKPNGKQKPLTIDAERLHTSSSRDKRFNLTTLDVLRQFVEEHSPRATKNDLINEQIVLDEFKAHLLYHVRHLMDLHASIRDISYDITDVQRRKNETRKSILELKRKHVDVGTELAKVRKDYMDDKQEYSQFQNMVDAFNQLKGAVSQQQTTSLSDKVQMELDNLGRIYDPRQGLAVQLQAINAELSSMIDD